jgi:hypothetical protein
LKEEYACVVPNSTTQLYEFSLFCQHFCTLRHSVLQQYIYFVRNTQAQARAFPLLFIIVWKMDVAETTPPPQKKKKNARNSNPCIFFEVSYFFRH